MCSLIGLRLSLGLPFGAVCHGSWLGSGPACFLTANKDSLFGHRYRALKWTVRLEKGFLRLRHFPPKWASILFLIRNFSAKISGQKFLTEFWSASISLKYTNDVKSDDIISPDKWMALMRRWAPRRFGSPGTIKPLVCFCASTKASSVCQGGIFGCRLTPQN